MDKVKKTALILILIVPVIVSGCFFKKTDEVTVKISGSTLQIQHSVKMIDQNDIESAMLPHNDLLSQLEIDKFEYRDDSNSIEIYAQGKYFFLVEGNTGVLVNTQLIHIPYAPIFEDNKFYLPIKFIAENLGYVVKWDKVNKTINIEK